MFLQNSVESGEVLAMVLVGSRGNPTLLSLLGVL